MNSKRPRPQWTVGGLAWGVALLALLLNGVIAPTDASGLIGLTGVGHGLVVLAIAFEVISRKPIRPPPDANFVSAILAIFLVIELAAFVIARQEREDAQALWFAAALSFSSVAILACRQGGASDGAIAAQILFHGLLVVPALGAALILPFSWFGNAAAATVVGRSGPITARLFVVVAVIFPIAFVTNLAVLANDHARAFERPSRAWTALLVHESAYVLLAARWAYDGI